MPDIDLKFLFEKLLSEIDKSDFSSRTQRALLSQGYKRIAQIVELGPIELRKIPNLGKKSVEEIEDFITESGLHFYMDLGPFHEYFQKSSNEIHEYLDSLNISDLKIGSVISKNKIQYTPSKINEDKTTSFIRTIDTLVLGEGNSNEKNLFIDLSKIEFSARTRNYFINNNLKFAGDIVSLTKGIILRTNNTGKKTVEEIESFLATHGLKLRMDLIGWPPINFDQHIEKYQNQNDPLSNFWELLKHSQSSNLDFSILENHIINDLEKFLEQLSDKHKIIFKKRLGYGENISTLEELGTFFDVTRERIRQIEAKILKRIPMFRSVNHEKLKSFLLDYQSIGFLKIFPKLSQLFSNKNINLKSKSLLNNNLINFIEVYSSVEKDSLKTPEKIAVIIMQNYVKMQTIYKDLKFPIDKHKLCYQISKIFRLNDETILNSLRYLINLKFFSEDRENKIYPIKISKRDEILSILNHYPDGINQHQLFDLINVSVSKNIVENYHGTFATGSLDPSEYIFCGKGKIKATKFGNFELIDQNTIFPHIQNYLKERNDVSNLKELYEDCLDKFPDKVDIYDLRYLIKIFGIEHGIYFDGKSQAQTVSLGKKIRLNHQQELEHKINKSKNPLNLFDLEGSFSGVNQLIKVKLSELVSEGKICRYDINEWWGNNKAYKDIHNSFEEIKDKILDIVNSKKYTSLTFLIEEINNSMSIYESRYFIESLIKKLNHEYQLNIIIKSELVSYESEFNGIQSVLDNLFDEKVTVEINYERISLDVNISFKQFKNFYSNFIYN